MSEVLADDDFDRSFVSDMERVRETSFDTESLTEYESEKDAESETDADSESDRE